MSEKGARNGYEQMLKDIISTSQQMQLTAFSARAGAVAITADGGTVEQEQKRLLLECGRHKRKRAEALQIEARVQVAKSIENAEKSRHAHDDGSISGETVHAKDEIRTLQRSALEAHGAAFRAGSMLRSVRQRDAVTTAMYTTGGDELQSRLRQLVNERDHLAVASARIAESAKKLRSEIFSVRQQRQEQLQLSQALAAEIADDSGFVNRPTLEPEVDAQSRTHDVEMKKNIVIRTVFKYLVLESGVDWFGDPSLREVVLEEGA